jgi:biotin--protein ligase
LSSLPVPLLSLASRQLAGRGRGTNSWLTPPGCLPFSLLLRVQLSSTPTTPAFPSAKLVFIQYLCALAVVEACRDEKVLGERVGSKVRVKWPNDIYADFGVDGKEEFKKVGGILVNTQFEGGKVDIVVGS